MRTKPNPANVTTAEREKFLKILRTTNQWLRENLK
jgi:hypothetical protein